MSVVMNNRDMYGKSAEAQVSKEERAEKGAKKEQRAVKSMDMKDGRKMETRMFKATRP